MTNLLIDPSEAVILWTGLQRSLFLKLGIESQHWWRFYTFMMSDIVTKVLELERNVFWFLIYCIFNGNSGKALSAVIWFKFPVLFVFDQIPYLLVPCSLLCSPSSSWCTYLWFYNKIPASTERQEKEKRKQGKVCPLALHTLAVVSTVWLWNGRLFGASLGSLEGWSCAPSLVVYTVPGVTAPPLLHRMEDGPGVKKRRNKTHMDPNTCNPTATQKQNQNRNHVLRGFSSFSFISVQSKPVSLS